MQLRDIGKRIRRIFKKGSGIIPVIEDQSKSQEYNFTLDISRTTKEVISDIKNAITANPWTTSTIPPDLSIIDETEEVKKLEVRFRVISSSKGKELEEELRKLVISAQ